ncbi:aldo/keto reductase [Proteinivorax tanatarense]|uniref:Aldo/keto reductase n=1 Tax=Proteinivorax tanatarense TaxID=1260629 RepID=A0AAU7VNW7_9FIRM
MLLNKNYHKLGNTELEVSPICFGTLTMGPLQRNLTPLEGAKLLSYGYEKGINFIDTAEIYDNYAHIKKSMEMSRYRPIISTKSYCFNKKTAQVSVEKALTELGVEYLDVFLLHEQSSYHSIRGHYEAVETLLKYKERGLIKHVGVSTHHIQCVRDVNSFPEIDVIHPIFNVKGLGIVDGNFTDMAQAIDTAFQMGKGIYVMKALGGGHLIRDSKMALEYVFSKKEVDSVAIGMQSSLEIDFNIQLFNGVYNHGLAEKLSNKNRELIIHNWCQKCGKCVETCPQNALTIEEKKVKVIRGKCVFCGYCSRVCSDFCIKVI